VKRRVLCTAAAVLACVLTAPATAQTAGITVNGDVPKPYVMTAEIFRKLDPTEIAAEGDDGLHWYRAVPLHCFIEEAGIPFGDALRVPQMAWAVIVTGRDGTQVVLSLASLDETFGGGVYLADAVDDRPLGGDYRLVIPADWRPTRWVRQVEKLTVRASP
jgi:hypothetical protein